MVDLYMHSIAHTWNISIDDHGLCHALVKRKMHCVMRSMFFSNRIHHSKLKLEVDVDFMAIVDAN